MSYTKDPHSLKKAGAKKQWIHRRKNVTLWISFGWSFAFENISDDNLSLKCVPLLSKGNDWHLITQRIFSWRTWTSMTFVPFSASYPFSKLRNAYSSINYTRVVVVTEKENVIKFKGLFSPDDVAGFFLIRLDKL